MGKKIQSLRDKKLAIETHIRELELNVIEPPRVGSYNSICSNCHIRGHRIDGNSSRRGNDSCKAPPCTSYYHCGQKKKHSEHFEEIKNRKKELKEICREVEKVTLEKKNLDAFQSKSISAFSSAVTPRLCKAFGDKYCPRTSAGKIELQKDIATLRIACNNKIPPRSETENDRELFISLLENQRKAMNEFSVGQFAIGGSSIPSESISKVSPVHNEPRRRHKRKKSKVTSSSESSSNNTSDSSADHRKKKHQKRRKSKAHKKSLKLAKGDTTNDTTALRIVVIAKDLTALFSSVMAIKVQVQKLICQCLVMEMKKNHPKQLNQVKLMKTVLVSMN
jgi:hypothetical protein